MIGVACPPAAPKPKPLTKAQAIALAAIAAEPAYRRHASWKTKRGIRIELRVALVLIDRGFAARHQTDAGAFYLRATEAGRAELGLTTTPASAPARPSLHERIAP